MPLVLPILRLAMVLQNVYGTYKVLRAPPPSSRNSGRPSVRAVTQRKRDMKGCLAIWIVWCCFATYERTIDRLAGLFVPFYDELKCIVILFLLVTRARGAEPIFLHVLRPMLRPYTSTIDSALDLARMFGDILFVLSSWPLEWVMLSWQSRTYEGLVNAFSESFNRRQGAERIEPEDETESPTQDINSGQTQSGSACSPMGGPTVDADAHSGGLAPRSRASEERVGIDHQPWTRRVSADRRGHPPGLRDDNDRASGIQQAREYQVWLPPRSSYDDAGEAVAGASAQPLLHIDVSHTATHADPNPAFSMTSSHTPDRSSAAFEEWRRYPAFPAAYPYTPVAAPSTLPLPRSASDSAPPRFVVVSESQETPILQRRRYHSSAGVSEPVRQDSFGPIKVTKPGDDSSDEEADEDDEFDVTLRTPYPIKIDTDVRKGKPGAPSAVSESAWSPSTGLTTVDNGSSLRTESSTESSASESTSATDSSTASRSRKRTRAAGQSLRTTEQLAPGYERVWSGNTVVGIRRISNTSSKVADTGDLIVDGSESEINDDRIVPGVKRRKVAKARPHAKDSSTRAKADADVPAAPRRMTSVPRAPAKPSAPVRSSSRIAAAQVNTDSNEARKGIPAPGNPQPRRARNTSTTRK